MQKPWKVLSTAALVTALSVSMVVPAFAANGDIVDTSTGTSYSAATYRSNTATFNTMVNAMISESASNQFTYEYGGNKLKLDDLSTEVSKLMGTGKTVTQALTTASTEPALIYTPSGAATVSSVSAVAVTTVAGTAPVLPATVTATMSDGTTTTPAVTWAAVAASQYAAAGTFQVTGTVAGTTKTATATVTVTAAQAAALAIQSVTQLNISQIKVVFNKAVDTTAGTNVANYTLKDSTGTLVTIGQATLNSAATEATLTVGATAPSALTVGTVYTVTVTQDLSSTSAPTLATALLGTVTANADLTIPNVTNVQSVGNKIVRVTFSKPVTMNGTPANIFAVKQASGIFTKAYGYGGSESTPADSLGAAYTTNSGYTQIDVTATNAMPVGTQIAQILGSSDGTDYIADAQGYKLTTVQKNFDVTAATTVAQPIKVTVASRTQITVKFDQPVTPSGTVTWIGSGKSGSSTGSAVRVDDTTVQYTFDSSTALPVGSVVFTVPVMIDSNGNSTLVTQLTGIVPSSGAVTATAVQNAPSQTSINVTFSAAMQNDASAGGVLVPSSYTITLADGTKVNPASVTYNTTSQVATLTLTNIAAPGTLAVVMTGLNTALGDATGSVSTTVAMADKTAPTGFTATGTINTTTHDLTLYIQYNENMIFSGNTSVLLPANISVVHTADSTPYYLNALPTGFSATISKVNEQRIKVVISGTSDYVTAASGTTDVTVQLVADAAGNIIASPLTVHGVSVLSSASTIDQTTAAVSEVNSVKVTGARTMTVKVDNAQFDSVTPSDFVIEAVPSASVYTTSAFAAQTSGLSGVAIPIISASAVNDTTGFSTITLTTSADIPVTTKDIFVGTTGATGALTTRSTTGLGFVADRVFANGLSSTNAVKALNGIAAQLTKAQIIDGNDMIFEFSNEIVYLQASDFKVTVDGATTTISPDYLYTLTGASGVTATTGRKVKAHFTGTPWTSSSVVTLKTIAASSMGSVDATGTKLAEVSTPFAVTNVSGVQSIVLAKKASDTLGGALSAGDTIKIKFGAELPANAIVGNWIKSIKLVQASNKIELFDDASASSDDIGDITSTDAIIPASGNGHVDTVTATKDLTDPTLLVLTVTGGNIAAYDMENVSGNIGILAFNTVLNASVAAVELVDVNGNYFNMQGTAATPSQLVDAKTMALTAGTGTVTVATNYGSVLTAANTAGVITAGGGSIGTLDQPVGAVGAAALVKAYIVTAALPTNMTSLTLTPNNTTGVITITGAGTGAVAQTTLDVVLYDVTDNTVLKHFNVPVTAAGTGALTIGTIVPQ